MTLQDILNKVNLTTNPFLDNHGFFLPIPDLISTDLDLISVINKIIHNKITCDFPVTF